MRNHLLSLLAEFTENAKSAGEAKPMYEENPEDTLLKCEVESYIWECACEAVKRELKEFDQEQI